MNDLSFERDSSRIGIKTDSQGIHITFSLRVMILPKHPWFPVFEARPQAPDEAEKWINFFENLTYEGTSFCFKNAYSGESVGLSAYLREKKRGFAEIWANTVKDSTWRRDVIWAIYLRFEESARICEALKEYFAPQRPIN